MKVKDITQWEVTTLGLEDSLGIADDIMLLGRIRHLPVVAANGRLVGLVTQRDLLKASVASVLQLGRKVEHDWLGSVPVRLVMNQAVTTVGPESDLAEAVELMITRKFGCIPVVEDGRLVGMLTETDCLRVLCDLLPRPALAAMAH